MIPRSILLSLALLFANLTIAAPTTAPTTSPDIESLVTATADRFAHAVDHADVAAATAECSLPFLDSFNQLAPTPTP